MFRNPNKAFVFLLSLHISYCFIMTFSWTGFFLMLFMGIGWLIPESNKKEEDRYSDAFLNGLFCACLLFWLTVGYLYWTNRFLYDIKDTVEFYSKKITPFVLSAALLNSLGISYLCSLIPDKKRRNKTNRQMWR